MIRRYWIVQCDYCGLEHKFNGSTKPSDKELKERGIVVRGMQVHYCDEYCATHAEQEREK